MPSPGLSRSYPRLVQIIYRHIGPALQWVVPKVKSPRTSARAAADLLTGPEYGGAHGLYFVGTRVVRSSTQSYDRSAGERLWAECDALLEDLGLDSARVMAAVQA